MNTKLYHSSLFIPENILSQLFSGTIILDYSKHAINSANSDRYGRIILPAKVNVDNSKIIELEVLDNEITKVVYRVSYSDTLDICIVLIPSRCFVKTVWLNSKEDTHRTLDISKYCLCD